MNEKRGQVTVFIILALVIVVLGVLIYLFYPKISSTLGLSTQNPDAFIQECMEDTLTNVVTNLSSQGGSLEPQHYFVYQNQKLEYLCYTNEYYKTCIMQQPMLQAHIESEIKGAIEEKSKECFDSLKQSYEKKGYQFNMKNGETKVELLPKMVLVTFGNSLTLTKENTENYNSFQVILNNNLYELVSITNSILNYEATYGDSETTFYMDYYPDLKVEKYKQSDGTTVYILTNRDTLDKFQFASRSVAWPPGISTITQ
jgi:hypothetical protein